MATEHTVFYDGHTGCSLLHTLDFGLDAICGIQVRGGQFAQSLPFDLVPDTFVCLVEVITGSFLCALLPVQDGGIPVVVQGSNFLFLSEGEVEVVLGLVLCKCLLFLWFDWVCMADERVVPHH